MIVFNNVGPHEAPILGQTIGQRCGRTCRAREGKWAKDKLVRAGRLPCSRPSIAVDSYAHSAVGGKCNAVLCLVDGTEGLAIAALKLQKLPGRACEIWSRILLDEARFQTVCESREKAGEQQ